MTTWLIFGSSPSAPDFLDQTLPMADIVATTNAGIYYIPEPHYYGVFEIDAPRLFGRFYERARAAGTKLVTSTAAVRNMPAMAGADVILPAEQFPGNMHDPEFEINWTRGRYVGGVPSGAHMLQFAVNQGATRVLLVGMEGYASAPSNIVADTFDGRMGPAHGDKVTRRVYGPLVQRIVQECPDVFFNFYGKPRYPLVGHNVYVQAYPARLPARS